MYVCICNAVTDKQIRRAARQGAESVSELRERLGVASNCGSCADQAREILDHCSERRTKPRLYVPCPA
ncbi:MAG: bacterioferritin-associated ferredoxin [Gammaproteobacteria bacterium]|nr:bacterioferritin-associated ferredoxin [Gammaproteobacteria bacterium]